MTRVYSPKLIVVLYYTPHLIGTLYLFSYCTHKHRARLYCMNGLKGGAMYLKQKILRKSKLTIFHKTIKLGNTLNDCITLICTNLWKSDAEKLLNRSCV